MTIGVFALVLMVPTIMKLEEIRLAGLYPTPFSKFLYTTFAIELLVAFFGLGVCGIFARWVTFLSKHPIHSSNLDNVSQNSSKNQKREKEVLSLFKSLGLTIDELSEQK